jgi:hypothetical protein
MCVRTLQQYVSEAAPESDPRVEKCSKNKYDSLCFVSSLHEGERRTYPFRWNCVLRRPIDSTK